MQESRARKLNPLYVAYDRGDERRWGWQRAGVSLVSARGGGAQLKPLEALHHHTHTPTVFQTRAATHSDASPSQSQQTLPHHRCLSVSRSSAKVSDTHVTTATVSEFTPAKAPWKWREIGQRAAVQMQRQLWGGSRFVFLDEQLKIVLIMPVRRGHVAPQNTFLGIIIRKFEGQSKYYKSNILDSLSPYRLDDKGSASINIHRQI